MRIDRSTLSVDAADVLQRLVRVLDRSLGVDVRGTPITFAAGDDAVVIAKGTGIHPIGISLCAPQQDSSKLHHRSAALDVDRRVYAKLHSVRTSAGRRVSEHRNRDHDTQSIESDLGVPLREVERNRRGVQHESDEYRSR